MRSSVSFAVALALVACAGSARADGPEPIVVSYDAPKGCPKGDDFRKSVEKRSARTVTSSSSTTNVIRAQVSIDAKHAARVKVTAADRVALDRELKGKSCSETAEASALLVAMFADRDSEPADEPSEEPAQPEPASGPPAISAPVPNERPLPPAKLDPKSVAITANPVSLLVYRYSAQVDVMLAKHHAITLNPFFVRVARKYNQDGQAYDLGHQNGVGGEIGYRYYTGDRGMNGLFFGPSAIATTYWADANDTAPSDALTFTAPETFSAFGAAFDLGGQVLIGPGVVLGAGLGVQYIHPTADAGVSAWLEGRAGVAPRFLLALGYAF